MSVEEQKALSKRLYVEIFGEGRYETADEILSPDVVSHGPGQPPRTGTEGIKLQAQLLRTAIPDLQSVLLDQLAEGDRVASRWLGTGTHTGPLQLPNVDLPPTGKHIEFEEIRIDRYENGRIVESWFLPDRYSLWEQLGLIPRWG